MKTIVLRTLAISALAPLTLVLWVIGIIATAILTTTGILEQEAMFVGVFGSAFIAGIGFVGICFVSLIVSILLSLQPKGTEFRLNILTAVFVICGALSWAASLFLIVSFIF